ncbi:MAG: anaerobic glycerol-3-phosphate dehydrogenase subunit C, partial [Planctomycetota bacterium]
MDSEQTRIEADLRGLLDGDVHCDDLFAQMYASDASIYEIRPLGVVRPRSTADVARLMRYCNQHQLPVFARGGGSGLAGQALGRGIVVDFSRYMNRQQMPHGGTVRVQAGVVQADLNRALAQHDRIFGPDPASRSVTTIGSMLSIDASGSHFLRYGSAGDWVESMQVVLSDGQVVELSSHRWGDWPATGTTVSRLAYETGRLLQQHLGSWLQPPWEGVARGCGYRVEKVLDGDQVHLARLLCGAEGTLGVITEVTLRTAPLPPVRGVMLLFFNRLDTAARAAIELRSAEIAACDLMDRRLLEIARETDSAYEGVLPRGAESMLLVEIQGEVEDEVRGRLLALQQRLQRKGMPVVSYRLTTDRKERNLLWRLSRRVIPRLYRLKGNLRPLPFIEDIAIAPERLPEFLHELQNVLKAERVTATLFAHAAQGQIDVRPFLDLSHPEDQIRLGRLSDAVYEKVIAFRGCISGEHALGLSRAAWAEKQLGPRLELFRKIKRIFDPTGILNPGKFLSPTPPKPTENLRPVPTAYRRPPALTIAGTRMPLGNAYEAAESLRLDSGVAELPEAAQRLTPAAEPADPSGEEAGIQAEGLPVLLAWDPPDTLSYVTRTCNGCARCRTSAPAERMCPMFRVHRGEEASPRAKANLLRGILTGRLEPEVIESRELKAIADLCFNCHQCRMECPASVNIPKLVLETKAQHVAAHGLPLRERLLNRIDLLAAGGSRVWRLSNWAMGQPAARWLLERVFGIAQGRKLPRVARRSFLKWATRHRLNRPAESAGRKVLFFVDQYVNWHNPLLGRAVVETLQHHEIDVFVPTNQTPSWMSMIASGDVERARRLARHNVKVLADAVRLGYEIVTAEPSAALCLREEYRYLIPGEDTELISQHTREITSYLWDMHLRNELKLDFNRVQFSILYHEPCHMRVLNPHRPGVNLLRLIPGIEVELAENGCSGMAGTYGLQRKNYWNSLRIGRGLTATMRATSADFGATECTACKLQMEQPTDKPTVHPIAVVAYAYGLMPQLAGWFTSRNTG